MSVDALLLLQRSDVAAVRAHADAWSGVPLVCIDPGLLDDALAAGLDPERLDYRPLDVGPRFQSRLATEAMTRALRADQALARERERLWGDGAFDGWDHVPLRFLFLRAAIARRRDELAIGGMYHMRDWPEALERLGPDTPIPAVPRPEDILIMVVGGEGKHSAAIPSFGPTVSVTRAIEGP